ncbi:MAG: PhzF family phenazine biosynthesis protein, partial [Syntrophobacteraceae bacterium]
MKIPIYQVDAFTSGVFSGNPAAVCPLDQWLPDSTLQAIAAENNLSETAFVVPRDGEFELRWFTPLVEVALCGHATLAAAFVLFELRGWAGKVVTFQTR